MWLLDLGGVEGYLVDVSPWFKISPTIWVGSGESKYPNKTAYVAEEEATKFRWEGDGREKVQPGSLDQ